MRKRQTRKQLQDEIGRLRQLVWKHHTAHTFCQTCLKEATK